jgi:hypothetical protein
MKNIFLAVTLFASFAMPTFSQDTKYLSSAEVQSLASGKVWLLVRTGDKKTVRWEIKSDGYIFGDNRTTPSRDVGNWTVSAKDQLCIRWKGKSYDNCYRVQREGEKINLFSPENLKTPASIVTLQ